MRTMHKTVRGARVTTDAVALPLRQRYTRNMRGMDGQPLGLTPKQVADRIGVTVVTLYVWRREKRGPDFYKISNTIYYRPEDIEAWFAANKINGVGAHLDGTVPDVLT